ncbi:hypothetical protein B0H34DRAFT_677842 [Crassisporium funariophilum]|nr:hypothetical protein B0H34DRAFT_677842 [Crassisporium funariophilum]
MEDNHFTCQVFSPIGSVWKHNGLVAGGTMTYEGNIADITLDDLDNHAPIVAVRFWSAELGYAVHWPTSTSLRFSSPVARHTAERISSQTIFLALGVDLGFSQVVQKLLMEPPNSRTQELEADLIGLRLMSRACYKPEAAPQMFARMSRLEAKAESSVNLDFLQTHPSSAYRVKEQMEAFKERAHEVKFDDRGGFELA